MTSNPPFTRWEKLYPRRLGGTQKMTDIQLEDLNNLLGVIEFHKTFARRQEAESERSKLT